ncbi:MULTISPECIES: 3-hydroxyacyl-CoA dehydrogenase NAD-binding domain-containing protein [Niastella]|uniref:3-hydroxybutyryl-CoA dehydrogenase n=1 Tax=Niastella soli TaxID=2821487 RepID=A0ABS3YQ32_9BACT|nr:3-hydroxyacyl-CoA dehydrogenase NAD-binding domain-containing protein [Niastella soli]MBO9200026.1 3-hydroxybutyryl-CoA dehydrogenase [Niastella soli]
MVQTICVCGAGTMGSGIAQAAAQHNFFVILYDVNEGMLNKARTAMESNLQTLVQKNKLTAEASANILSRIRFASDTNECLADLVIEAIVEKPEVKVNLFNQLAEVNHSDVVFATNTSSLSVTEIAKKVARPQRVAGMHFFNPATIMKLVEVVATPFSNQETIDIITQTARQMDKTPVLCQDAPGFIVNHVARPYYLEALKLVEQGVTDFQTIDTLLEASGFKMGPFRLMDLIGNDINYAVSCQVYDALGKPDRLQPSPIQKERVEKGELGRKTGKGYYDY